MDCIFQNPEREQDSSFFDFSRVITVGIFFNENTPPPKQGFSLSLRGIIWRTEALLLPTYPIDATGPVLPPNIRILQTFIFLFFKIKKLVWLNSYRNSKKSFNQSNINQYCLKNFIFKKRNILTTKQAHTEELISEAEQTSKKKQKQAIYLENISNHVVYRILQ